MKSNKKKIIGIVAVAAVAIVCLMLYINRPSKGSVERITTAQLVEKFQNDDTFAVVMTQTTCPGCKKFLEMMDGYLKDNKMVLYDVVLDTEANREQAYKELVTLFPEFTSTPDVYYIEKGEVKSSLHKEFEKGTGLLEKNFDDWATKYNIVE